MENMNQPPQPETLENKLAKLNQRMAALKQKDLFAMMKKFHAHGLTVQRAYREQGKDAKRYRAYHALISSNIESEELSPEYDFPEPEYSVEKFIADKEKEYTEKK